MTFDPMKPVQTRDGRKARILATDIKGPFPIAAVIDRIGGIGERVETYSSEGCLGTFSDNCPGDLVNIPERRSVFRAIPTRPGHPLGGAVDAARYCVRGRDGWADAILEIVYEGDQPVAVALA